MNEVDKSKFFVWLKRRKRILIGIATILLLIFMVFFVNFQSLVEKVISVGIVGLLIFIASYTVAFILRAFKLKLIFKGINKDVTYSTSLFSIGAAFVINDLTPAKLGDFAKILIIKDKENIRLSESTAAIAIERVLDLILLFSISCFALIYLYLTSFGGSSERLILGQTIQFYIIIGAVFIIGIFILFLLLLYKTETILKIIRKLSKKLAHYLERFIINFKEGMTNFKGHKKELIYIILLGFPTWIIDAAIVIIFFYPLDVNVIILILAKILTFFSKTFPITPGGWGISENVGALFTYFFYPYLFLDYGVMLSIFVIDHLFRSAYLLIFGGYSILHYNIKLKEIEQMKK
ncbi:MAG: flippase-like domain-containing protein [Candidatus Lokiarchaeota archaeon]|nr:flippase-like domain-containing protein [Candidatus Lokiarchaeota archaeon]